MLHQGNGIPHLPYIAPLLQGNLHACAFKALHYVSLFTCLILSLPFMFSLPLLFCQQCQPYIKTLPNSSVSELRIYNCFENNHSLNVHKLTLHILSIRTLCLWLFLLVSYIHGVICTVCAARLHKSMFIITVLILPPLSKFVSSTP